MPDQDGSKSQIRDWKILLVLTLIEVLKQCPIEIEKIAPPSVSDTYQGHCFKTVLKQCTYRRTLFQDHKVLKQSPIEIEKNPHLVR